MVSLDPENGHEIVMNYFYTLFDFTDSEPEVDTSDFLSVLSRIMPRILTREQAESVPEDMITTIPWVNDCVISLVIDFPQCTMSIRRDMMEDWGIEDPEELYSFALQNLWDVTKGMTYDLVGLKDDDGEMTAKACIFNTKDGYDSSRILLPQMYRNLSAELGNEYYVAIPSRDMFLAISTEHRPTIERVVNRMQEDDEALPHPLSKELFLCVKDGVAAGRLDPL
tara:strand:- start:6223 stop:6894 length:672 start_codon:yes stop_codon:yes gene_type:complete